MLHGGFNLAGQLDLPGQALLNLGNSRLALAFGFFGLLLAQSCLKHRNPVGMGCRGFAQIGNLASISATGSIASDSRSAVSRSISSSTMRPWAAVKAAWALAKPAAGSLRNSFIVGYPFGQSRRTEIDQLPADEAGKRSPLLSRHSPEFIAQRLGNPDDDL
jgi:hypothetical protein